MLANFGERCTSHVEYFFPNVVRYLLTWHPTKGDGLHFQLACVAELEDGRGRGSCGPRPCARGQVAGRGYVDQVISISYSFHPTMPLGLVLKNQSRVESRPFETNPSVMWINSTFILELVPVIFEGCLCFEEHPSYGH